MLLSSVLLPLCLYVVIGPVTALAVGLAHACVTRLLGWSRWSLDDLLPAWLTEKGADGSNNGGAVTVPCVLVFGFARGVALTVPGTGWFAWPVALAAGLGVAPLALFFGGILVATPVMLVWLLLSLVVRSIAALLDLRPRAMARWLGSLPSWLGRGAKSLPAMVRSLVITMILLALAFGAITVVFGTGVLLLAYTWRASVLIVQALVCFGAGAALTVAIAQQLETRLRHRHLRRLIGRLDAAAWSQLVLELAADEQTLLLSETQARHVGLSPADWRKHLLTLEPAFQADPAASAYRAALYALKGVSRQERDQG